MSESTIVHVDMDAFYASVEECDRPELRGQPLVVGGNPAGRGVVAAASYAARAFGIHSAMPAVEARRRCPQAVFLRPRMARYVEVSREIHAIFRRYTPEVESLSLDEAFLDLRASWRLFGAATHVARRIKREIRDEIGLVASVGVAPNKFLAKIASDVDKPDGLVLVESEAVQDFLDPLPVSRIWGVGRVTGRRLRELGIEQVRDLRRRSKEGLMAEFGSSGAHLWALSRGMDDRPVISERAAKSVGHEITFAQDLVVLREMQGYLNDLAEKVARRLRRKGLAGKTVQLKLRYADFRTISRRRTFSEATDRGAEFRETAYDLLTRALQERDAPVRLLGVAVSGLEIHRPVQAGLFTAEDDRQRRQAADAVLDRAADRVGEDVLRRGMKIGRDDGSN